MQDLGGVAGVADEAAVGRAVDAELFSGDVFVVSGSDRSGGQRGAQQRSSWLWQPDIAGGVVQAGLVVVSGGLHAGGLEHRAARVLLKRLASGAGDDLAEQQVSDGWSTAPARSRGFEAARCEGVERRGVCGVRGLVGRVNPPQGQRVGGAGGVVEQVLISGVRRLEARR